MKKILILAGRYLPGYKDGGPVRTLINLIELLGDEYEFRLAVLDRDHGDLVPYPDIKVNDWNQVGKAKVYYYREGGLTQDVIVKLASEVDLVYSCGFYDGYGYNTLILNRKNKLLGKPVIVASMGSFTKGALSSKKLKKRTFIFLCKLFGLFKNITWSATSQMEVNDIRRVIGKKAKIIIAEDLPRASVYGHTGEYSKKGYLNLAFIARLCKHKNLLHVIESLKCVSGKVKLTIAGPIEDEEYWQECQRALKTLPSNVDYEYVGEIDSDGVMEFLSKFDAMALPTLGENYCHAVYEALSSGCVPIVSDRTPWNWINDVGAGYVVPLEDDGFTISIQKLIDMTDSEKAEKSNLAVDTAKEKLRESTQNTGYRKIFG